MSYEKPVKQCQDSPTGFRTMNALTANQDDTKAVHDLEHVPEPEQPLIATGFGDFSGDGVSLEGVGLDLVRGGQHETPKVARGTLRLEFDELFAVGSSALHTAFRSGVCTTFVRLGVGSYFVPISGFSKYGAHAWPLTTASSAPRLVEQTPAPATSAPGIYVSLWEEHFTLGFQLADFSFQLSVYAFRGGAAEAPAPAPIRLSRFAHGPRGAPTRIPRARGR